MEDSSIVPVILSGGSGTRLWPLSRKAHPKQFLKLENQSSLLQSTLLRCKRLAQYSQMLIVANQEHRFLVAEHLRQININDVTLLLEPCSRNTAPAVLLAALYLQDKCKQEDPILWVSPSDHIINDESALFEALQLAVDLVKKNHFVTFGILPTYPETGYGYIKVGNQLNSLSAKKITSFVEKPNAKLASEYIKSGGYLWNSGMFVFRTSALLAAAKRYIPGMFSICSQAMKQAVLDLDFLRISESIFSKCPEDSIDYAIMEKIDNGVVIPLNAGWSDIGDWTAIAKTLKQDERGNSEQGDVISIDNHNCFIQSNSRLVATLGLENVVIVETPDAILVVDKQKTQQVKKVVSRLSQEKRIEVKQNKRVYRPWGYYETVAEGERFKVKRILIQPGEQLSLQLHHHRSEHWVVVRGTAKIHLNDKQYILSENESTYMPIACKHRLENIGKIPLIVIEVQSGSYLGEDDIIRFTDLYGRETLKTQLHQEQLESV